MPSAIELTPRLVRRLAAVTVEVPDPASTADFLVDGLDFIRRPGRDGIEHVATEGDYGLGPPGRELSLVPGEELRVAGVVFEVDDDALAMIEDRLSARGIEARQVDADDHAGHGLAFGQPDGVPVECRVRVGEDVEVGAPSSVRPRRLGHVNLKMPSPPRAMEFFCDALGLRLSEQLGEMLYFLRVNSDHHNLAFRPADRCGVHHVAFELAGWDSIRVVCDNLVAHGYTIEYGPGRHAPGHQLFVYVRDPSSGLRLELFTDMAHIDDDEAYEPIVRDVPRFQSVNTWGPAPPDSFLVS